MKSFFQRAVAAAALAAMFGTPVAHAATASSSFQVQLTVQASCSVTSATALDFGTATLLSAAVDQTTTLNVECSQTTPYNVGLNAGTTAGGTTATRKLTAGGAQTIDYALYRDAARTQLWGDTIGTDTLTSVGTGASQNITVYGRAPAQTTPAPGVYTDTVTVTVTY
jgi:spore coat protein U-like protein